MKETLFIFGMMTEVGDEGEERTAVQDDEQIRCSQSSCAGAVQSSACRCRREAGAGAESAASGFHVRRNTRVAVDADGES